MEGLIREEGLIEDFGELNQSDLIILIDRDIW